MMYEPVFSLVDLALFTVAALVGFWWSTLDVSGNGRNGE